MSNSLNVSIDNNDIVLEHDAYCITITADQVPQLVEELLQAVAEINQSARLVIMEEDDLKQRTLEILAAMERWPEEEQWFKDLPAEEKTTSVTCHPEWYFRAAVRAILATKSDFDIDNLNQEAFDKICNLAMHIVCQLDNEEADGTGGGAYADMELNERFHMGKIADEEIRAAARGEIITKMHGPHEPVLPVFRFEHGPDEPPTVTYERVDF
jgi:hypothetical protein